MLEVVVSKGPGRLGRPTATPEQNKKAFMEHVNFEGSGPIWFHHTIPCRSTRARAPSSNCTDLSRKGGVSSYLEGFH
jgi:hypothetical protein